MTTTIEQTTLAGGCFWCIESAFNNVKGIESAVSGYMGGETSDPTYEKVCSGTTGHAEVVQLSYDPSVITYREILEIFFALHNPTQLNRQGNDTGTQYRSGVFFHTEEQQQAALSIIDEINQDNIWPDPVVTEVTAKSEFYSGEDMHQGYFNRNPENPYCQAVVAPKLAKFKKTFVDKLK
ncbi:MULTISPECIES: peptide-methionine (S)-S-oxide reductase MsrA [Colwelliaceae]|uniref:peptide-methionine (S)-S-oxide reductase MsrA n=1 Tax=Colwelliaceae TaxID=267889 RepID=UPI00097039D8|nr:MULTISPECIES: peptide-methionine (S)-S-oxide reductase MsrA [Colwelliaceae]